MKHTPLESGVLPVFRLFAALWLILVLLGGVMLLIREGFSQETLLFLLAGVGNALLLLGYLLWPRLQRLLGSAYLPGAIVIASVGPILVSHLLLLLHVHPAETVTFIDTWPLAAILFVPLVIVAWQHSLRSVIVFCLGTGLLDVGLALITARGDGVYFFTNAHAIITRTILLFLVGYMVSRIMGIQHQQRQSLAEANARLTHYATTLEQLTTTRERNRLARELHDTLAHTLSAVAVELEAVDSLWEADSTQARALLQRSLAATRTGLTETRRALQALRSSPLEDLGLALAIYQEAQTVAERSNWTLDLRIPERVNGLPPDAEQCVYRVAQEALANAAHHARAQCVTVSLLQEDSRLTLAVSDDGRGFDPAAIDTEHHLGIRGMQERAEMVSGILEIESELGQGTTVRLTVEEKG
jgi:signal transduction histidine kinase